MASWGLSLEHGILEETLSVEEKKKIWK